MCGKTGGKNLVQKVLTCNIFQSPTNEGSEVISLLDTVSGRTDPTLIYLQSQVADSAGFHLQTRFGKSFLRRCSVAGAYFSQAARQGDFLYVLIRVRRWSARILFMFLKNFEWSLWAFLQPRTVGVKGLELGLEARTWVADLDQKGSG